MILCFYTLDSIEIELGIELLRYHFVLHTSQLIIMFKKLMLK